MQPVRDTLERAGANLIDGLSGRNPWGSREMLIEPGAVKGFYSTNSYIAGAFAG